MPRRLIALIAVLVSLSALAAPGAGAETRAAEPRLVAVVFSSWLCGPCRILEPRIHRIAREFEGRPVEMVRLDFTFGDRARVRERAAAAGILDVYRDHRGSTGFMLLIDRETGDILARITARYGEADIRNAFAHGLSVIRRREDFGL